MNIDSSAKPGESFPECALPVFPQKDDPLPGRTFEGIGEKVGPGPRIYRIGFNKMVNELVEHPLVAHCPDPVPVMAAEGEKCGLGNSDVAETAEMNEECLALFVHRA